MNTSASSTSALVQDWLSRPAPQGFPLGIHKPTGQFCKKIKGQVRYFGKLPDWRAAWDLYDREREAWESGRNPRETAAAILNPATGQTAIVRSQDAAATLYSIVTLFLRRQDDRRRRVNPITKKSEMTDHTFLMCKRAVQRATRFFGEQRIALSIFPDEWAKFRHALYEQWKLGSTTVQHNIIYVRAMSKWAHEVAHLIPEPFHFGDSFAYVPKSEMRVVRRQKTRERGEKLFPLAHIAHILDVLRGNPVLLAMFLLSLNGAMNATDCSELTDEMVDWERGVLDFDRKKTGIQRYIILWPETLDALKAARMVRPEPAAPEFANRVFLTQRGRPWVRQAVTLGADGLPQRSVNNDEINKQFMKVVGALDERFPGGVAGVRFKRPDIGFSIGRHTAQSALTTVTDRETRLWISGHAHRGMDDHYIHVDEQIQREIAQAVADTRDIFLFQSRTPGTVTVRTRGPRLLPVGGGAA